MQIKIEKYTKFPEGKVKGISDIVIMIDGMPLTIKGVKVIPTENGGIFYAMPDKKYTTDQGEEKYTPVCAFFTKQGYQEFHSAIQQAFKSFFQNDQSAPMKQPEPPPQDPVFCAPENGVPF